MRCFVRLASGVSLCVLGAALVVGCQSSGQRNSDGSGILRAGLPPSAQVVTEGSGQLTYTPEEAGQVYLYDVNQDRVIGRFQMRRGQRLAMDGVSGRATIDGNEVRIAETKKNGNYQVYFLADPMQ
jgi:murein L,D-transpeptidase YcbB/YkuD